MPRDDLVLAQVLVTNAAAAVYGPSTAKRNEDHGVIVLTASARVSAVLAMRRHDYFLQRKGGGTA
jgi:ribosomal protein L34